MDAPPLGRRLAYRLLQVRLPPEHRGWVEHDLTGPGWRWRLALWWALPFAVFYTIAWTTLDALSGHPLPWWFAVVQVISVTVLSAAATWAWPRRHQRRLLRRHGFHVADEETSAALWWPGSPDDPRSEPWR